MKKKEILCKYVAPRMQVAELEPEVLLQTSGSSEIKTINTIDNDDSSSDKDGTETLGTETWFEW